MKLEELRDLIVETLGCDAEQVTPEDVYKRQT